MGRNEPACLVAAVAHAREQDEAFAAELEKSGVKLVPDLPALLAMRTELDAITLPVGIHLHVPMAMAALQAGYHVYLEKPVAGAIQDGLILADAAAKSRGRLFIGYQDMYQPATYALKRELLAREHGALRKIVVMAAWPRDFLYYDRNSWVGKLAMSGTWVFDSPANNACAHYLNLALFWAGVSETASAQPATVTAELSRANRIESADTTCLRMTTVEGVEIIFAASHACRELKGPLFRIECAKAVLAIQRGAKNQFVWTIQRPDREPELRGEDMPFAIALERMARALNGEKLPVGTLEQALAQTRAVNGAFLSAPIRTVPDSFCAEEDLEPNKRSRFVRDMNRILEVCFEQGCLPSETGLAPWSKPGRIVAVHDLTTYEQG